MLFPVFAAQVSSASSLSLSTSSVLAFDLRVIREFAQHLCFSPTSVLPCDPLYLLLVAFSHRYELGIPVQ